MLINCTPHPLTIHVDGRVIEVPPSGNVVRVTADPQEELAPVMIDGLAIPVISSPLFSAYSGLPEYVEGVSVVVGALAAAYLRDHPDCWPGAVFGPDTGPDGAVRDENGRIIGVRRLVRWR